MSIDLKLTALSHTDGHLESAKVIYAWLIEGAPTAPVSASGAFTASETIAAQETATKTRTRAPKADKAEKAPTAEAPATGALDYAKDVQPEVLKAGAISRENTLAIIQSYGVSHAKDVPPEKFAELVARCKEISGGSDA